MHKTYSELEQGLERVARSPRDAGVVKQIVCRPAPGERRRLQSAELDQRQGLLGDNWLARGNPKTANGEAHPDMQLNLMNARAIALIAGDEDRWQLAGDQFYVDLDLSPGNLPPGTLLSIGEARIEVTAEPHLGCAKFIERFGRDAALLVNSEAGRALNLRGINARVVTPGRVDVGAAVRKLERG